MYYPFLFFPSQIPAPGSEQNSFFSSWSLSQAGRDQKCPVAKRTRFNCFPFPPAIHLTEGQTQIFFWDWTAPASTHILKTDYLMLPSLKDCPIQYLVDRPKVAALHHSFCPGGEPQPCFSSSKITPSPQDSVVDKNTRSRYRESQRDLCTLSLPGSVIPVSRNAYNYLRKSICTMKKYHALNFV